MPPLAAGSWLLVGHPTFFWAGRSDAIRCHMSAPGPSSRPRPPTWTRSPRPAGLPSAATSRLIRS